MKLILHLCITGAVASIAANQTSRINDNQEFQLEYTNWWQCRLDNVMDCYGELTQRLNDNIRGFQCKNASHLISNTPQYRKTLHEVLETSILQPIGCRSISWTEAMTVAANIILQRSQRCQLDYVTLLTLAETVNHLFSIQQNHKLNVNRQYQDYYRSILHSLVSASIEGQPHCSCPQ